MKNYRIHLIRALKTQLHLEKSYIGRLDPGLCEEGVAELDTLLGSCFYPKAQTVFTSPLRRALDTAGLLYPDTFTIPVPALTDIDMGEFEGRTFDELKYSQDFLRWVENSADNPPPGGEGMRELAERACSALESIFRRMMDEGMTNVAVITHRPLILALLAAMGMPRRPIHEWTVENGMGFTILLTPQLWLRDNLFEVQGIVPYLQEERLEEEYLDDLWEDEDGDKEDA